jgi:hypothetical protein
VLCHQLAQHHRQHAAVAEVLNVGLVVEPAADAKAFRSAIVAPGLDLDDLTRL